MHRLRQVHLVLPHEGFQKIGGAMKQNMGRIDRGIRILLVVAVAVLFFLGKITGIAAVVLGVLAAVFLLTSLIGFCPLYVPLKISTRGKK